MWKQLLRNLAKTHGPRLAQLAVKKLSTSSQPHIRRVQMSDTKRNQVLEDHDKDQVSNFLRDDVGEFSTMRLMFITIVIFTFGMRIWGMYMEHRFIPLDWPEVSLLTACFGGKALQTKYEGMYEYSDDPPNKHLQYGSGKSIYDESDDSHS